MTLSPPLPWRMAKLASTESRIIPPSTRKQTALRTVKNLFSSVMSAGYRP